ncbi:hypothetical protein Q5752_003735 [Cryptotrichosporon argae]
MSRIPVPSHSAHGSPTPDSPSMFSSDTRKKQSKRDESDTISPPPPSILKPSPPPSQPSTPDYSIDGLPTPNPVNPLPTPPSSTHTSSPDLNAADKPLPPSRTSSSISNPARKSVAFPTSASASLDALMSASAPAPDGTPAADATNANADPSTSPARPRYHSTLSRSHIATSSPAPTLSRSSSRSNFSSKLQSLRKKIESELSRKRPGQPASGGGGQKRSSGASKKAQKGTVAGLRPSPALTVPEGMTVADASQLCAAKRTDCVLVVDEEEGLSGIFTAKDLAFRVTADGLDPRTTTVAQIMTKNPMVTRDTTSATEALQLMVSRHFRHLDGDVVGLLDITKVFHDALAKVERGSSATSQLSGALAAVQSALGPGMAGDPQAAAMLAYADSLRERMAQPDLTSVLDTRLAPPTVSPRTSVRDAARLMKERRTTAVCVMETNSGTSAISGISTSGIPPKIAGIFTSKDIVLRVIAAGLDASRCSVVRVMTPHPDTAPPTTTVQDALKKMHNGHYLNLPVVEADGKLLGIADVLKLTYATLEHIESMNEDRSSDSGPMWSKFFDNLNNAGGDDDTASVVSHSDRPDTPSRPPNHHRGLSNVTSPISEVQPGDSASVIHDNASDVGFGQTGASSVAPAPVPVDDGTYVFKFRTPSGRTHRFQARHDSYELLRDIVYGKLIADPFFVAERAADGATVHLPDPAAFTLSYTDDDGDLVTITADGDVADAVRIARGQKTDRVVLFVSGGKGWEDAARDVGGDVAVEVVKAAAEDGADDRADEKRLETPSADPATEPTYGSKAVHTHTHGPSPGTPGGPPELLFGVLPKDLALPAAVGFLGVVIVGVFIASRGSK